MGSGRTVLILGMIILVAGLAVGFGIAMLVDQDEPSAVGEVQNAQLKVGDKAPEFELYDHTGTKVWLSDFRGKKNIVLAFYPAAWTPV